MACMVESPRATRRMALAGTGWADLSCQYLGKVEAFLAANVTLIPISRSSTNARLTKMINVSVLLNIRLLPFDVHLASQDAINRLDRATLIQRQRPSGSDGGLPGTRAGLEGQDLLPALHKRQVSQIDRRSCPGPAHLSPGET